METGYIKLVEVASGVFKLDRESSDKELLHRALDYFSNDEIVARANNGQPICIENKDRSFTNINFPEPKSNEEIGQSIVDMMNADKNHTQDAIYKSMCERYLNTYVGHSHHHDDYVYEVTSIDKNTNLLTLVLVLKHGKLPDRPLVLHDVNSSRLVMIDNSVVKKHLEMVKAYNYKR